MQLNCVPRYYHHRLEVSVHLKPRILGLQMALSYIEDESPNSHHRGNEDLHLTHRLAIDREWCHETNQNNYDKETAYDGSHL
jgi:hypothetical protein